MAERSPSHFRSGPTKPRAVRPSVERGASLIVSLLMLVVTMLLGLSAARMALQEEKASRSGLDRQIAYQAAHAALLDAEADLELADDASHPRGIGFRADALEGFVPECAAGIRQAFQGLCLRSPEKPAVWLVADLLDDDPDSAKAVSYGRFTGRRYPTRMMPAPQNSPAGSGAFPSSSRLPRYIIEAVPFNRPGEAADPEGRSFLFQITGIGFGMRDSTYVVLQSAYRKEEW